MPYKFQFLIHGNIHFEGVVPSSRCRGHCRDGSRCRRLVIIGYEYCFQHLKSEKHLTIHNSTIPGAGLGLFAFAYGNVNAQPPAIVFHIGDTICQYQGQILTRAQLDARYDEANGTQHNAPYAIRENANRFNDAALRRTVGSLANTRPGHNNATISVSNGPQHRCSLRATRNIRHGDEIFLAYGNGYHLNEPGVTFRTTK
jgi:hypothetical protein